MGLRAHVELSEISTLIVRNNFKEPGSVDEVFGFIKEAHAKLQAWKDGLPEALRLKGEPVFDVFGLAPQFAGVDRAVCMLHMAHNQVCLPPPRGCPLAS
jgi:hypothetical protein